MKLTTKVKNSFALGQIIQQARMEKGYSQRELAAMLGISQKWVWEMEQGKPGILMDRLFIMLDSLNIKLSAELEFTERTEEPVK